jgi:phosphatidate cytidylyltransferase
MTPRSTRVLSAGVLAPVAIAALLWLPTEWLALLLAVVMVAGLWEWTALVGLDRPLPRAAYLVANGLLMAALAWGSRGGPDVRLVPLKALAVVGAAWWLVVPLWLRNFDFASQPSLFSRAAKLFAGSLCVVPAWAAAVWLHYQGQPAQWSLWPIPAGAVWTLFAVAIIWAADTGAYFVGSRYGKRKLAPRISPGKSWEGLYGGLGAAALLAVAAVPLLHVGWTRLPALLVVVLATVLVSVVGDLFESLLKRHAGVKDSSDLIPGHGGILDRIDSLLAALPVFVVLCGLLHLSGGT